MAAVLAGVGAVVALLFFVFVLQSARLSNAQQKLEAQQAVNADLQQLKLTVAAREALISGALNGQVAWSGVLRDISTIIPSEMWLTGMNATLANATAPVGPASGTPSTPGSSGSVDPSLVGTIQFQGVASNYPTVARWLTRLEKVDGWVNSWASNASRTAGDPSAPNSGKVQFSASVDLTTDASVQGSKQ